MRRNLAAVVISVVTIASAAIVTSAVPTGAATRSAAKPAAGTFGDLTKICGPGDAKGGVGRGVTPTTIRVATMADPSNTVSPKLGQEYFDIADTFVKWCNAAGGINGRKLQVDKRDSKLFEVGARMVDACQDDFMMVGNGTPLDDAGVKPRLDCKLGQIPSYQVSPTAVNAGLQVQPTVNATDQARVGAFRLLKPSLKGATAKTGVLGSNLPALANVTTQAQKGLQSSGYAVVDNQSAPATVDNYRPYIEKAQSAGVQTFIPLALSDLTPYFQTASTVGFTPKAVIDPNSTIYSQNTIRTAASVPMPPTWTAVGWYPFELAKQNPAAQQLISIFKKEGLDVRGNLSYLTGWSAWLLFAKSATACGSELTSDCVLQKAGAEKAWTAGGLSGPVNLDPAQKQDNPCVVIMKVSPKGFVYDKKVTQPNNGVFNCSPKNIVRF